MKRPKARTATSAGPLRSWPLKRGSSGVTIMEVLISIFILLIGVVSIIAVFPAALQLSVTSSEITSSAQSARTAIEELIASQAYTFPSGVTEAIDSSDSTCRSALDLQQGYDHRRPYYCIWDRDISWRDLVDIVTTRGRQYCAESGEPPGTHLVLVKKNSPGDAERRYVRELSARRDRTYAAIRINRGDDPAYYDPLDTRYYDRTQEWLWPVRAGARYWMGNFREDRSQPDILYRFPSYARVQSVETSTIVCQVVQEGASSDTGTWGAPRWTENCWKGFVLIHTGDRQELMSDEGGATVGAYPTERASAAGRAYLITANDSARINCARADFLRDGLQPGDFVRIAGNALGRAWWPEGFLSPGSFYNYDDPVIDPNRLYRTQPVGAGSDYSYACIFSGWENDTPDLYRIDIFIYRNFNPRLPPEQNAPVARFGTMLAGR